MSAEKYPSIFSRQMKAIVYLFINPCYFRLNTNFRSLFLLSFFKCLWKVVRNLPKTISEVRVDQILLDIHTFLLTHPHQMWKNRADDTPLRTIKTVLYTLGKLKKHEVR